MALNRVSLSEEYRKHADLKPEDVKALREWLGMQPHLPQIDDLQVILFLYSCYCSNEATKKCIDNYYTVRTHCPEFFANRNPNCDELKSGLRVTLSCPLPKLTPEGYCIIYSRFVDTNADQFVLNTALKMFDMSASLHLQEIGALDGHIIVIDLEGVTLTHVMKLGLLSIKKYLFYLQEALPFRLKGFHFVNAVPFMDKILALMKPFMKKELMEMLQIHTAPNATVFASIPKEYMPVEAGGTCGSVLDFNENFKKKITGNVQYFANEEKLLVDESKRPGKPKNAGELFGVEGTFKKLDID